MRVLFLVSDTGGGHRAAAVAIEAAMKRIDPSIQTVIRDALVETSTWPFSKAPGFYAFAMRHLRWLWAILFYLTNGPRRARVMVDVFFWPFMRRRLIELLKRDGPDLIVSVHPFMTRLVSKAKLAGDIQAPFAIVVTDLVTAHASWFDRDAHLISVPTEAARDHAISCLVDAARVNVLGQPLHPRAMDLHVDRDALRALYGWNEPVVLCVGGGDGMGNLGAHARAIARSGVEARVVVICGRNRRLEEELQSEAFPVPVEVHGFMNNLPEMMAAADLLVTKGGPGSVVEGCLAGLPILVYDYIPGQEYGNVQFVLNAGIGAYVPHPSQMAIAVSEWLERPDRSELRARAKSLVAADSSMRIAKSLLDLVQAP